MSYFLSLIDAHACVVAQCTIERMLSPNRPLSCSNRPGTPLRPSAVSSHCCLAAPPVWTVAVLPISSLSRPHYSPCSSLCHPPTPHSPTAFPVLSFTSACSAPCSILPNVSSAIIWACFHSKHFSSHFFSAVPLRRSGPVWVICVFWRYFRPCATYHILRPTGGLPDKATAYGAWLHPALRWHEIFLYMIFFWCTVCVCLCMKVIASACAL